MEKHIILLMVFIYVLLGISQLFKPTQAKSSFEHNLRYAADPLSENVAAELRYIDHVKRHMKRQAEHRIEQEAEVLALQQLTKQKERYLKNMPRLWQHLQETSSEELQLDKRESAEIPAQHDGRNSLEAWPQEENSAEFADTMEDANDSLETTKIAHTQQKRMRCPKCEQNRNVAHVTEEELTQLRIEYVKQQILEKLRIKEPPNVSASVRLPIERIDTAPTRNKDLDDYYARSSKKFIFLEKEERECTKLDPYSSSICFSFKINDADIDGFDVNTAVLWIFKNNRKFDKSSDALLDKETFVVSELQQSPDPKYLPISKTIAIQSFNVEDEWLKIDIEWPTKRWFGNHELSHLLQISCQSCGPNALEDMISVDQDYRPFIMINTQNRTRNSRQKRGINCTNGVTECCREKLYISFEEIGWGDWIIQPQGYDAYFCRGSCNSVASVAQSTSHHHTFLQKLLRSANTSKPLELIPCCTAKQYSTLQLIFMDNNNTATQRTFPNMVVESCGCR